MFGLPAELALRERCIEDTALQLSRPGVRELRLRLNTGDVLDPLVQLQDRRLDPRADVQHSAGMLGAGQSRGDGIADVHVVARLRSVPEHLGSLALA